MVIVGSVNQYDELLDILQKQNCATTLEQRRRFAAHAFAVSSHYDSAIFNYFNRQEQIPAWRGAFDGGHTLRYGENPHQKGAFFGDLEHMFTQLHGKEISYDNMLDIDAAVNLIAEFEGQTAFAILKHNNACGVAVGSSVEQAWKTALACDPVSAFGGVLISNGPIDAATAEDINKIFFEVILAPYYEQAALDILFTKKNRIVLKLENIVRAPQQFRSILNGVAVQDRDCLLYTSDAADE